MAASPTPSIRSREIIGSEAFSKRRDVFGRHDTVFFPSPLCLTPSEFERATAGGTAVSRFRRTPAYSSMRETRRDDIRNEIGFRERKMSDNFTSENHDDVDYRKSLTERTKRISKLRHEFLTSNLYDTPGEFNRSGTRASLPARPFEAHKITATSIYKFPFAEPYGTPPPTRKLVLDASETDSSVNGESETPKRITVGTTNSGTPISLSELMKRYSPRAKPLNMTLPPTKPRVIATVAKQNSADDKDDDLVVAEKLEIVETKLQIKENGDGEHSNNSKPNKDKVSVKGLENSKNDNVEKTKLCEDTAKFNNDEVNESTTSEERKSVPTEYPQNHSKSNGHIDESSDEENERDDKVPEIPKILRQDSHPKKNVLSDETIPALLDKIEKNQPEQQPTKVKVKRKRSFWDKLMNKNKNKNK